MRPFRRKRSPDPVLATLSEFLLRNAMVERQSNYAPKRVVTGEAAIPEWTGHLLHRLRDLRDYEEITLDGSDGDTFGPVNVGDLRAALRAYPTIESCPTCGQVLPPGGAARADA